MSTVTQQNTEQETPRAIVEAVAWAAGWGDVASFLTANPDIAKHVGSVYGNYVLCPVSRMPDPVPFMASAAQACVDAGGRVEPYRNGEYGGVNLWFGPASIQVYAGIAQVYAERVTGMVEKVEYTLTFDLPEQDSAVNS